MPTTPTPAYLTTVAKVKLRLPGIPASTMDSLILELIQDVQGFIEGQCDRVFKNTSYSAEKYDGVNANGVPRSKVFLRNYPVTEITSFEYQASLSADTWMAYRNIDYILDPLSGILKSVGTYFLSASGYSFPASYQNLRVTYKAGYLIDWDHETDSTKHNLPRDLHAAATKLVVREFKKRESIGRRSEGNGSSNISWLDDIDADIMAVLASYQRMEV